jgi:hypothetical protein
MTIHEHHNFEKGLYMFHDDENTPSPYTITLPDGVWMVTSYGDVYDGRLSFDNGGSNGIQWLCMEATRGGGGCGNNALRNRPVFDSTVSPAIDSTSREKYLTAVKIQNEADVFVTHGTLPSNDEVTIDLPDDDYWVVTAYGPSYYSRLKWNSTNGGWIDMDGNSKSSGGGYGGRAIFHNDGFKPRIESNNGYNREYYLSARRLK